LSEKKLWNEIEQEEEKERHFMIMTSFGRREKRALAELDTVEVEERLEERRKKSKDDAEGRQQEYNKISQEHDEEYDEEVRDKTFAID